ncbi:MAG TPA: citrate/2-methylcitrate synthase, partial [Xanthomonadales bacterium]|nr:citrate/2-methylcitrate synthase [Xanthomonadales bacterium]
MAETNKSAGLRGQTAGQTAICTVGAEGNSLRYRGYDVADLAENASFNEVAFMILHGHLPNQEELTAFSSRMQQQRQLPAALCEVLERIPADAH